MSINIKIDSVDFDALARIANGEVGHFSKYGSPQLTGGVSAVVDTVINRAAHKSYPNSIIDVIEQPKQFSPLNELGSWELLASAPTQIGTIIRDHLTSRVEGKSSAIAGATHFLNPHYSSPTALKMWGDYVVDNATAVYGDASKKDVHYHGFPPSGTLPKPHTLTFEGQSWEFEGDGSSETGMPTASKLAVRIVDRCFTEFDYFDDGKKKENDHPQYLRVGDYWKAIGLPYDGRTKIKNSKGKWVNPAWSSAFISWLHEEEGVGHDFGGSQAHCHYFQRFVDLGGNGLYTPHLSDDVELQVGDIVHYGREYAKSYDFVEAQMIYGADSFYPSHSDVVVEVDQASKKALVIGGNVSNSVNDKTIKLDNDGKLVPREESGIKYPWIGILRLT